MAGATAVPEEENNKKKVGLAGASQEDLKLYSCNGTENGLPSRVKANERRIRRLATQDGLSDGRQSN